MFYAVVQAMRGLVRFIDRGGFVAPLADRCFAFVMQGPEGVLLVTVSAALFYWVLMLPIRVGGTLLMLLPSYHFLVRFTWPGALLNGHRRMRMALAAPAGAGASS